MILNIGVINTKIFPEDNLIYIDGEEKPEEILEKILNIIEK